MIQKQQNMSDSSKHMWMLRNHIALTPLGGQLSHLELMEAEVKDN